MEDTFLAGWKNEQNSTDPETGDVVGVDVRYYPNEYHPIEWIPTQTFYDNEAILQATQSKYAEGDDFIGYDPIDGDYYSNNWMNTNSIIYK